MAQMDARIILAGQAPDVAGSAMNGVQLAQGINDTRRTNALAQLYRDQGAAMLAGDQGALNALAGFDPAAALGFKGTLQSQQFARNAEGRAAENHKLALADRVTKMSAAEAAAESEAYAKALEVATMIQTPEQWDAFMAAKGLTDLVGQFDNRDFVIAEAIGVKTLLDAKAGMPPETPEAPKIEQINGSPYVYDAETKQYIPAPVAGGIPQQQPDTGDVDSFRKEFSSLPVVKSFAEQSAAFGRIVASAKDPTAAGDLALIFNYMKLLDPGSTVREGEFATAQNAGGVDSRIVSLYNNILNGTRLSDSQRADFVSRAQGLYKNAEKGYEAISEQYAQIATNRNYPLEQAVIDFRYKGEQPQPFVPDQVQGPPLLPPDENGKIALPNGVTIWEDK